MGKGRVAISTKHLLSDCGVSRRDMMRIGAGGLGFGLFGGIGPVPYVFSQASRAAAANQSGKILVVFEWFGGNDGLNTIVPYGDPMYYKHRPTIGIKEKDVLKIDAHFGWHKSMRGMKTALRRGQGGDRAGRRLRPAVVLALHVDVVLAHGGAQQRQRVRLDWADRVGAGSRRRARRT